MNSEWLKSLVRVRGIVTICLLAVMSCDDKKAADSLLAAFQGACPTQGEWTNQALASSRALTGVFEELRDRGICEATIDGTIESSLELESAIKNYTNVHQELRIFHRLSKDLMTDLSDPNLDPDLKPGLAADYLLAKFDFYKARATYATLENPGHKVRYGNALAALNSQLLSLVANSRSLAACLSDNPSEIYKVGANILTAGAHLAPPLVGMGIAAANSLFTTLLNGVRSFKYADAIYETYSDRMKVALTCGFEALTDQYCKMKDAYEINEERNRLFPYEKPLDWRPEPVLWGVHLIDKMLPIFYRWTDRFLIGPRPATSEAADRRAGKRANLDQIARMPNRVQGVIAGLQDDLQQGLETKFTANLKAISRIVSEILGYRNDNGTFQSHRFRGTSIRTVLEAILGKVLNDIPPNFDLNNYLTGKRAELEELELITIEERVTNLVIQPQLTKARAEFEELIISDSSQIIQSAKDYSEELPPVEILRYALDFLQQARYTSDDEPGDDLPRKYCVPDLYEKIPKDDDSLTYVTVKNFEEWEIFNTCKKIVRLISLINKRMDPDPPKEKEDTLGKVLSGEEIIERAHSILQLENENILLPELMERYVRNDLVRRLIFPRKGDHNHLKETVKDILYFGFRDIIGTFNRTKIDETISAFWDLSEAMPTVMNTTLILRERFMPALKHTIRAVRDDADEQGDGVMFMSRARQHRLCILTFITGESWDEELQGLCADAILKNKARGNDSNQISISGFQKEIRKEKEENPHYIKTFYHWACRYRDYLRSDEIFRLKKHFTLSKETAKLWIMENPANSWCEHCTLQDALEKHRPEFPELYPELYPPEKK